MASEEAFKRYQGDWDSYNEERVDDWGYTECERRAFVAGAEFAAEKLRDVAITQAAAVGWDAAVAAMRYEDGTPVELALNHNPYRKAS
jgi:hypothetical protein